MQRVHKRKRRELRDVLGEYDENILRPLEIFTIVSSNSLSSKHQEHTSYNEINLMRQKRNALVHSNRRNEEHDADDDDDDETADGDDSGRKQSLEERVKDILLLKKKYQKPRSTKKDRDERKTNIRLTFALKPEILNLSSSDIEEANIRLVLIHSPILAIRNSKNKKTNTKPKNSSCGLNKSVGQKNTRQVNVLNLKLYFINSAGKRSWLDGRKVDIHVDLTKPDGTHTQWLQFDVSKAVKTAIENKGLQHIVLELQCDNCKRIGARILNDAYNTAVDALAADPFTEGQQLMPVLNIIGHFDKVHGSMRPHKYDSNPGDPHEEATTQHHYHHHTYNSNNNNKNRQNRRTNCYKANQRCCRHSMEVTFKEIKGFEFIIQPKVFDAGYCHGRCPPRYNPAHHHAMLQSLIWKQNHHKAPRPCCAPSKLVELEVLHVDEKDSDKLKISTWSDMKVVECACS